MYPVGSLYFQAGVATNPASLFGGGTWVAFGAGRVLVGLDSGDTDFDTLEEVGGAKTQPTHVHTYTHKHPVDPPLTATVLEQLDTFGTAAGANNVATQAHQHDVNIAQFQSGDPNTGSVSANGNESIVQPYIVVHIWKRTA
jgi:hypothetical protein